MSRNRDIRGFFGKPADSSSSEPKRNKSSHPMLDPQPAPSIPGTPPQLTSKPRDRTDEIKGSDDEDDDSDDSLESISVFIERKHGPITYKRDTNITSTPKAKRVATNSTYKSPLTIQPKHKFDLKYLVNHARQSDKADESARRADELINQSDDDGDDDDQNQFLADVQNDPALLQKTAKDLLDNDDEDAKGDKLMRAMNRTKVVGPHSTCYFFSLEPSPLKPSRWPFPHRAATGCWRCLANSQTRDQAFIHGLPHTIVTKGHALPDELFLWILDEICIERNAQLRAQYCNLVAMRPDSITRLVTDVRLYSMLEKIGGPKYPRENSNTKLPTYSKLENPYPRKDWGGLAAFLELLERIAPELSISNRIGAIQLLLRLALDPVASIAVPSEHAAAMQALVKTLPKQRTRQWNEICVKLSTYVYEIVDSPLHYVAAISHMPRGNSKALDLRQRMAAAALFQDVSLSRQPVNEPLKLDAIMSRLDEDDFRVNGSTDFENLRSLVMLLDIVIDNASFLHPKEPQPAQAPLPQKENHVVSSSTTTTTTTTEADFDTAIDRLTFRLKLIHDKIHDSNQLARKVTKSSIDLVAKRLTYAVRTRPPPKTSIFDLDPSSSAAAKQEDENAPRQRAFMKNWSLKRTMENKEKEKGKDVEDVEVGGGGGAGRSANGNGNGDANGDKEKKKKNGNEGVGGSNGGK